MTSTTPTCRGRSTIPTHRGWNKGFYLRLLLEKNRFLPCLLAEGDAPYLLAKGGTREIALQTSPKEEYIFTMLLAEGESTIPT